MTKLSVDREKFMKPSAILGLDGKRQMVFDEDGYKKVEDRFCDKEPTPHCYKTQDGKYVKERSPLADDFRDIIDEYPLFSEYDSSLLFDDGCVAVVYHKYKFPVSELRNLKASDFDDFTGPDLENKEINTKWDYYDQNKS